MTKTTSLFYILFSSFTQVTNFRREQWRDRMRHVLYEIRNFRLEKTSCGKNTHNRLLKVTPTFPIVRQHRSNKTKIAPDWNAKRKRHKINGRPLADGKNGQFLIGTKKARSGIAFNTNNDHSGREQCKIDSRTYLSVIHLLYDRLASETWPRHDQSSSGQKCEWKRFQRIKIRILAPTCSHIPLKKNPERMQIGSDEPECIINHR